MTVPAGHDGLPGLSVRRPVLSAVLNGLLLLAGVAALTVLEVRELPDVERPVVSVFGSLPGAAPETMDAEVARRVEAAVARVPGIVALRTSSEENNFRLHAEFAPGVDLDGAASDVREAVSRVLRELPDDVEQLTVVKADSNAEAILGIAVTSRRLPPETVALRVEKDIVPALLSVPGVADIRISGDRQGVLHVFFSPQRLAAAGVGLDELARVLASADLDVPAGSLSLGETALLVRAGAAAPAPEAVADIELRPGLRVGDVAAVAYGPRDSESFTYLDGTPVIGLDVIRRPGANTLAIAEGVQTVLDGLRRQLPELTLTVVHDQARFIRGALREVLLSLLLTVLIVVACLRAFLGPGAATWVPALTIPIALIATLAGLALAGFSLNLLTLLGFVLATGLVVDDAIVVLENIQHHRARGLGPRAAALIGTREVFFAVIATSAVLIAVFLPITLLPGTVGGLFREFATVLAVSVALSSFTALSLAPALCVRLAPRPPGRIDAALRALGAPLADLYRRSLDGVLARPWLGLAALALPVLAGLLSLPAVPRAILPDEDRGVVQLDAIGPDGATVQYMMRQAAALEAAFAPFLADGVVERLYTEVGRFDPNRLRITATLAPWEARALGPADLIAALRPTVQAVPGVTVRLSGSSGLNVGGRLGSLQFALLGDDYGTLYQAAKRFAAALDEAFPGDDPPHIEYRPTQAQLGLEIDRTRAAALGVPLDAVSLALRSAVDGLEVADLDIADRSVPVILRSAPGAVRNADDLLGLPVRNAAGATLPLGGLLRTAETSVAGELDRHAQRRAIEMDLALPEGLALADALARVRALAAEVLPTGVAFHPLGQAQRLEETGHELALIWAVAAAVVLLVLCGLFESLRSALIVALVVPLGLAAAVFVLWATGSGLNLYSQIGLILLVGLMAKNGILLVEFANQLRDRGLDAATAAREAALRRLRPVVMTTLSTALAGLPLLLGGGAGAEARRTIGWVMFAGLLLSAFYTLYLTPLVYRRLLRGRPARADEARRLAAELAAAGEP